MNATFKLKTGKLKNNELERADVNEDGKVSSLDYILIKNHIMGREKLFFLLFYYRRPGSAGKSSLCIQIKEKRREFYESFAGLS